MALFLIPTVFFILPEDLMITIQTKTIMTADWLAALKT